MIKTPFTPEELTNILSNYSLGEHQEFKPFEHGADQTNLLLVTTKGKFAFRYYEKRSKQYVMFEVELLQYLAKHDYPCPQPIKNTGNGLIGEYRGKPYAIFEFLEGGHSDSEENYKLVAEVIGLLHSITINLNPVKSEARDTYDAKSSWGSAVVNTTNINSHTEAQERLDWLRVALEKLELPNTMPKGAVHGDTNPTNFLYKDGRVSAVLDFDQASYTYLLYDIANMLYWWAWPDKGELDFDKTKKLLAAYEQKRLLTEEEKLHLFDMLKMPNFMAIGWFISDNDSYANSKRKIEFLDGIGRETFYKMLWQ